MKRHSKNADSPVLNLPWPRKQLPRDTEGGPKLQPSWEVPMQEKGARWWTRSSQVGSTHSPPMKSEAGLGGATPEAVPPSSPGPSENLPLDDAVGPHI
ncbi:hypothetical protein A6R68_14241 [Neotoma lepida]|uniref:Uncharacterized protein n=1 Tax=Neotoma lepida TaxID=56216 RepID=A0A1A6HAC2_NEOLE|nr:hypothetical protein A6R68_14241 [Neotoma lepida]